jgi:hypothetical protein
MIYIKGNDSKGDKISNFSVNNITEITDKGKLMHINKIVVYDGKKLRDEIIEFLNKKEEKKRREKMKRKK